MYFESLLHIRSTKTNAIFGRLILLAGCLKLTRLNTIYTISTVDSVYLFFCTVFVSVNMSFCSFFWLEACIPNDSFVLFNNRVSTIRIHWLKILAP